MAFQRCGSAQISALKKLSKGENKSLEDTTNPLSIWLLTVKRTPGPEQHGPKAYACSSARAFPNSRLEFLSNSFLRTGSGEKRELIVTVVPFCDKKDSVTEYVNSVHCPTGLATVLLFLTCPLEPISRDTPIGTVSLVAVATVNCSHSAHKEDNASPRNPKVRTTLRSSKVSSFEV